MIVDDLRAASQGFRVLTRGSHVVRVPFEVCPFTDQPDGNWGLWWRGSMKDQEHLIPRLDDKHIDASWWRPPFGDMIIVSERAERGCLVVTEGRGLTDPNTVMAWQARIGGRTPDWVVAIALVVQNPHTGFPIVISASRIYALDGRLFEFTTMRVDAVLSLEKVFHADKPGLDEKLVRYREEIEALWHDPSKKGEHEMDAANMICTFVVTCALMGCKNVYTERVTVDAPLQRAREKRGQLPLVSYHVLKIRPRGVRGPGPCRPGLAGESLALHWVRGHFKHYTAERPLLGRAVGTYWWSPHLAGKSDRVVHKSYEIERK